MGLFSKTLFKWTEPWLVIPRERAMSDWLKRLVVLLLVGILLGVFVFLNAKGQWAPVFIVGLGLPAALLFLMDAQYIMRDIWLDETGFHCHSNAGKLQFYKQFPWDQIQRVVIERNDTIGKSYHRLKVGFNADEYFMTGIPRRLRVENLAQVFFEKDIPISLENWTPRPKGTRPVSVSLFGSNLSDPHSTLRQPIAVGKMIPLGQEETKLFEISHQIFGALLVGWPALLALGAFVWSIVWGIMNWNAQPMWLKGLAIGGSFALVVLSLQLVAWWAGPIETAFILRVARGRLAERKKSNIGPTDTMFVPISRYTEEACKKQIGMSTDDGFLVANTQQQMFFFEGNKQRWEIPFDSIIEGQVEEFAIGAETASGVGLTKWFVHLAFRISEGTEHLYLRLAHERFGSELKAAQRRADDLFLFLDGHVNP